MYYLRVCIFGDLFKICIVLNLINKKNVITQKIEFPGFNLNGCSVYIRREDLLHPYISGNKYHKLKYNIIYALQEGYTKLVTFGGAYSNHILATAVAAKEAGITSVGIIRGEELHKSVATNPTLRMAKEHGMDFHFISREAYRKKENTEFLNKLRVAYPEAYIIPEGGNNALAIKGCEDILQPEDESFRIITTAVGTGGTMAGIVKSTLPHQKVLGYSVLKGTFQQKTLLKYTNKTNYFITDAYCFGGYAKVDEGLINFINEFKEETDIPLDPIYTGKMLYGIRESIKNELFDKNSRILAIHTGGLQGIEGMNRHLAKRKLPQIII